MARNTKDDEMRSHYDFSDGVRGKYATRYAEGTNVVVLGPDLAAIACDYEADEDLHTRARTSQKSGSLKDVRKKPK